MSNKKVGPIGRTFRQKTGQLAVVTLDPDGKHVVITINKLTITLFSEDAHELAKALRWACDKIPVIN